jgi:phosphoribosylformylglycinamidine synthase
MELFLTEAPFQGQGTKVKSKHLRNDAILFSESNSRLIVEVERRKQKDFEKLLKNIPFGLIGCVSKGKAFNIYGLDSKPCVKTDIGTLKEAWLKPLRW